MKLLICSPAFCKPEMKYAEEYAEKFFDEVVLNPYGRIMTAEEITEHSADADAIIAGIENYTADVINSFPSSVRVISRYGVGYDAVDTDAAKARGICVTNTPMANTNSLAEHTLSLMLDLIRQVSFLSSHVKSGEWKRIPVGELRGKTLGIIGLGNVGKSVAKLAQAFGMSIIAYDPYINAKYCQDNNIKSCNLDVIITQSDIITLHSLVTESTRHMVNRDFLSKMKKTAYLINTARGALIDEDALYEALESKSIGGAALDVLEEEPPHSNRLLKLDNVVFTPHLAGMSVESDRRMSSMSVDNAFEVVSGKECNNIVNR